MSYDMRISDCSSDVCPSDLKGGMAGGSRRAGPADFRDQALALFLSARRTRASSEASSPSSCSADATALLASPGLKPRLINADTASPACPVAWGRAAAAGQIGRAHV